MEDEASKMPVTIYDRDGCVYEQLMVDEESGVSYWVNEVKNYYIAIIRKGNGYKIIARAILHERDESLEEREKLFLRNISVDEEYRRKGIATKLIDQIKKQYEDCFRVDCRRSNRKYFIPLEVQHFIEACVQKNILSDNHMMQSPEDATRTTVKFIDEKNKEVFLKKLLSWPDLNFDASEIKKAFDENRIMVSLNDTQEVVGYLIYRIYPKQIQAEIIRIEVKKSYQWCGVGKRMQIAFCEEFQHVRVLLATATSETQEFFSKTGWSEGNADDFRESQPIYRIVKPSKPSEELPDGCVIATCLAEYYSVSSYKESMRYFQIEFDDQWSLKSPLIIPGFKRNYYVAILHNQVQLCSDDIQYLFPDNSWDQNIDVLTITKITPLVQKLLIDNGFSGTVADEEQQIRRSFSWRPSLTEIEESSSEEEFVSDDSNEEQEAKRLRVQGPS